MRAVPAFANRPRSLVWCGLIVLTAGVAAFLVTLRGTPTSAAGAPIVKARLGNVRVTVGGVGRIVEGGGATQSAAGATQSTTGTSSIAPSDAVYPRTAGRIVRVDVVPGQRVVAGEALALIDDGGTAAAAVQQLRAELALAELELRQKRISDPLNGVAAAPAERTAARVAVKAARQRLARLEGGPRPAEIDAARLEVRRAAAELETLRGGTPAARADFLQAAKRAERIAKLKLERLLAGPTPADVSAAEADLRKAEAELDTLKRPAISPPPEALLAAYQLVNAARQDLARAQRARDLEQIRAALESLDSSLSDLAVLLRPGPAALPSQIAAAESAVAAARLRLERLVEPPDPADVESARLELDRARAEVHARITGPSAAARAAGEAALHSARQRLAQLLGRAPLADVTSSVLDVRRAEADLAVLGLRGRPGTPSEIAAAELKVTIARERLTLAQSTAAFLTLRAPRAGTVTAVLGTPGSAVDPATPLVSIADLGQLMVQLDLSEFDIAHVHPGLPTTVRVDALGGEAFRGTVRFASPTGNDTGGVVTFPVSVAIEGAPGLRPGMNVSVRIVIAERRGVVVVPLEAVAESDGERPSVTVIDASGQERTRRVTLGLANNKAVEIAKGVRVGERVVLAEPGGTSG